MYKRSTGELLIGDHFVILLLHQLLTRNPNDGVDDGSVPTSRTFLFSNPRSNEVKLEVPLVRPFFIFGDTLVVRFDIRSLWGLYKMYETLWFRLVSGQESWGSVVFVIWTIPLQDDTPVCHDCLVVNGTRTFITNIPSRHGC